MNNIAIKDKIKEFCIATTDAFKRKPVKSGLITAAVVTSIALAIILVIVLPTIIPLVFVIPFTTMALFPTPLISFFLFEEIKEALFANYKKRHTIDKVRNSDLVLVLEASHDHNGAFQLDQRDMFNQVKKKYALAYQKVSDIGDVASSIAQAVSQNNRIQAIWFRAHGDPHSLALSQDQELSIANVPLLKPFLNQVVQDGRVILDACSAAGTPRNGLNIAETMATLAKGRTVIAASKDTTSLSIKLNKANPLDMRMWTEHTTTKRGLAKYPSKFSNVLKYLLFEITGGRGIFKKLAFNATKIYRFPVAPTA